MRSPCRGHPGDPPRAKTQKAAIVEDGAYLLGKRREDSMLGGLWEFPGGKVEPGETHQEALRRELKEELAIDVAVGEHIVSVDHAYSHFSITLHLYACTHLSGDPHPHVHSEVKWVPRKDFDQYAFPAADLKFFDKL
jgi:A/G-specific adenine glycosylase